MRRLLVKYDKHSYSQKVSAEKRTEQTEMHSLLVTSSLSRYFVLTSKYMYKYITEKRMKKKKESEVEKGKTASLYTVHCVWG